MWERLLAPHTRERGAPGGSGSGQEEPSLVHPLLGDPPGATTTAPDADSQGSQDSHGEAGVGVCPDGQTLTKGAYLPQP